MAYNRSNLLKRIIEIQNLVIELQHQDEYLQLRTIYWKYIHPEYYISYRTFHSYLGMNARKELRGLQGDKDTLLTKVKIKTIIKHSLTTINKLVESFGDASLIVDTIEYKDGTKSQVLTICSNHPCVNNKEFKSKKTDNYNIKNNVITKKYK